MGGIASPIDSVQLLLLTLNYSRFLFTIYQSRLIIHLK